MNQQELKDQGVKGTLIIKRRANSEVKNEIALLTYQNEEVSLEFHFEKKKLERFLYRDVRVRGELIEDSGRKKIVISNINRVARDSMSNITYVNFGNVLGSLVSFIPKSA